MALTQPLYEGHQVLGDEDYCSGYTDPFGNWNNGFPCPVLDEEPVFCCGTESLKYCCVHPKTPVPPPIPHLALLLGIIFGVVVAITVVVVVSCFHCSCCFLYKKRQPNTRGSVYQMHCPSAASGVANMYSFSGTTTPSDTPRSASRASSSSRSRITTESGPSTISYGPYNLSDIRNHSIVQGPSHTYSVVSNSRPGSVAFSDRSTSTLSDITVREANMSQADGFRNVHRVSLPLTHFEPPPPYNAPHSTLVAVRTSSTFASPPAIPQPHTPPSLHSQNNVLESPFPTGFGEENMQTGSQLRTFPQTQASASSSAAIAALAAATRLPALRLITQNSQHQLLRNQQNHTNIYPLRGNQTPNHMENYPDIYNNQIYSNIAHSQPVGVMTNALTPTTYPCSTAHIINTHTQAMDNHRLYTATKF